jgi:hypothetical protein
MPAARLASRGGAPQQAGVAGDLPAHSAGPRLRLPGRSGGAGHACPHGSGATAGTGRGAVLPAFGQTMPYRFSFRATVDWFTPSALAISDWLP